MREIDAALKVHLAAEATTLCHAWRVTRRDGIVLGFTEHDHDLRFASTLFQAASGFSATGTEEEAGLPAATSEVAGGFSTDAITEEDLIRGRYDGARVEVFRVNWAAPEQNLLLKVQEIGEVTRDAGQFRAELRSFTHRLGQPQGRIYARRCDATLGDAKCTVDLARGGLSAEGTVLAITDATRLSLSGIGHFPPGFFRFGVMTFLDGMNAGEGIEMSGHVDIDEVTEVTIWLPLERMPSVGDRVRLTAGCDKGFSTCRTKFANQQNFRGFPHVPGADFAYTYVDGATTHDGGALFS